MAKLPKNIGKTLAAAAKKAARAMEENAKTKTAATKKVTTPKGVVPTKAQVKRKQTATPRKGRGSAMTKGFAKADLGTKAGKTLSTPYTAQYLPLAGDFRVSSPYGVDRVTHRHSGIDLAVPEGTKVTAAKRGKVSFAGWGNGYGYRIVVDHLDGTQTTYNHLSDIGVKVGDVVGAGSTIALSGNTGNSTGPHLHFEVKKGGQYVDPEQYFDFGNGLKSKGEGAYTSQMASAAKNSTSASSGKSASSSAPNTTAYKKKKVNLPAMEIALPDAVKYETFQPGNRRTADYFSADENPLISLIPSYRHRKF